MEQILPVNTFAKQQEDEDSSRNLKELKLRLNIFIYYFVQIFEFNLNCCSNNLHGQKKKDNSLFVTILVPLISDIPEYGGIIKEMIEIGDLYLVNRSDKIKSRRLANLIYFYNHNKDQIRETLINAAIEIFYCYEYQFMNVTNKDCNLRALHKLAIDATHRILQYLIKIKQDQNITVEQITEGLIKGHSIRNKYLKRTGHSVIGDDKKKSYTSSIYEKCGLIFNGYAYKTNRSNEEKYGYRRLFSWEEANQLADYKVCSKNINVNVIIQKFIIIRLSEYMNFYNDIRKYIMTKTPDENARLDREQINNQLTNMRENIQDEFNNLQLVKTDITKLQEEQGNLMQKVEELNVKVDTFEKSNRELINATIFNMMLSFNIHREKCKQANVMLTYQNYM